jgi:hypothetical protein
MTGSPQLRERSGCCRAKNADALDVKSRHPARNQLFGAVFRGLGRGAAKLKAGKERRPTLHGQLRGVSQIATKRGQGHGDFRARDLPPGVGIDGSAYVIGGFGMTALSSGNIIVVPIRSGVGLRLGANIGYLKFTPEATWNPL